MKAYLLPILLLFSALAGCKDGGQEHGECSGDSRIFVHAGLLRAEEMAEGWTKVDIVNPWDTTRLLQRLALVPKSLNPDSLSLPASYTIVRTPLGKSLLTTGLHIALIEELGAPDAIKGVTDVEYIKSPAIRASVERGTIVDCGSWMAPDIERIIKLGPDAIVLSPYQNGGNYSQLTELGIPIIFAADYLETTPLGRAEWMKFYGSLFGRGDRADSLFNEVESRYEWLRSRADSVARLEGRPSVILDRPYQGVWYAHGRGSANDRFIVDAGGTNVFSNVVKGSTVGISPEKYLMEGKDADLWLIRYNDKKPLTLEGLKADNPIFPRFKAFKNGNVWISNTDRTSIYEDTPFHPDMLLADLVEILHPASSTDSLRYFEKIK